MRKALYILGALSDQDIDWLIDHGRREPVGVGSVLIRQGQPISSFYLLLSGKLAVVDERLDGRELATLGSGEIVGEMSFLDARPPSATVRVVEDGVVLSLPRAELQAKLDTDPAFAARFYRAIAVFLSDRLRSTVARLASAGSDDGTPDAEQPDALDPGVLGTVHLASARFDRILKTLST